MQTPLWSRRAGAGGELDRPWTRDCWHEYCRFGTKVTVVLAYFVIAEEATTVLQLLLRQMLIDAIQEASQVFGSWLAGKDVMQVDYGCQSVEFIEEWGGNNAYQAGWHYGCLGGREES